MLKNKSDLIQEKNEVHDQATLFSDFIGNNPAFEAIGPVEQELLKVQNDILWQHFEVLLKRIKIKEKDSFGKPEVRTVQLSMDGLRKDLTSDTMELREVIEECFDHLPDFMKEEMIEKFDAIACTINGLNCVSLPGDELFNELDDLEVKHLGEGCE